MTRFPPRILGVIKLLSFWTTILLLLLSWVVLLCSNRYMSDCRVLELLLCPNWLLASGVTVLTSPVCCCCCLWEQLLLKTHLKNAYSLQICVYSSSPISMVTTVVGATPLLLPPPPLPRPLPLPPRPPRELVGLLSVIVWVGACRSHSWARSPFWESVSCGGGRFVMVECCWIAKRSSNEKEEGAKAKLQINMARPGKRFFKNVFPVTRVESLLPLTWTKWCWKHKVDKCFKYASAFQALYHQRNLFSLSHFVSLLITSTMVRKWPLAAVVYTSSNG